MTRVNDIKVGDTVELLSYGGTAQCLRDYGFAIGGTYKVIRVYRSGGVGIDSPNARGFTFEFYRDEVRRVVYPYTVEDWSID